MHRLVGFLVSKGFEFDYEIDNCQFYFKKSLEGLDFVYCLILPHEGTNNRYLFRANAIDDFDKWGNSNYSAYFDTEEDFINRWYEYLLSTRWE